MGNNTQSLLMDGSVPVVARTPLFQTPHPCFHTAASELTPAQRKAVEFAQQQILRAQQSQRRQSQHAAVHRIREAGQVQSHLSDGHHDFLPPHPRRGPALAAYQGP